MPGSAQRILRAFAHESPDRTPLFEIFQPHHPIHWQICGRTVGTDQAMCWDAMADGIAWEELIEAEAQAAFQISKLFELDMVRLNRGTPRDYCRPVRLGTGRWELGGVEYVVDERTKLVRPAHPAESGAYSQRVTERDLMAAVEAWESAPVEDVPDPDPLCRRVRELAEAEGIDWVYMAELGAGTGVAFYPPFLLMWMLTDPDPYCRWLTMRKENAFRRTRALMAQGHTVIALGGDVASDKGPFISPELYRRYVLPVIQEHVQLVHEAGALAVYTSDGNLWDIKEEVFFASGADGYQEVDKAAGMTFPRLIEEGIDRRICILGNLDARHTLCHGTASEVRAEVFECLAQGQRSPGGHILHASHSVHEDVRAANYVAAVGAYREYFGMDPL